MIFHEEKYATYMHHHFHTCRRSNANTLEIFRITKKIFVILQYVQLLRIYSVKSIRFIQCCRRTAFSASFPTHSCNVLSLYKRTISEVTLIWLRGGTTLYFTTTKDGRFYDEAQDVVLACRYDCNTHNPILVDIVFKSEVFSCAHCQDLE